MDVKIVSYGMGTNSTAMLIEMVNRGLEPPHAILAADTGGEQPETYAYRDLISKWLVERGYPPITTVKNQYSTLEAACLKTNALPSLAYGFRTCSQRFKIRPQERWCKDDPACQAKWAAGRKVVKVIGHDMDEPHRFRFFEDDKYVNEYPLLEWRWGRRECVDAICRAGLPQPGKSSCFFCPAMKVGEILALKEQHPDLLARAVAMEENAAAKSTSVKGLGRSFAWSSVVEADDNQLKLFDALPREIPCDCYDGEAA